MSIKLLKNFTWGVAGRNEQKLRMALSNAGEKANIDMQNIPVILADVNDRHSLKRMAESAKVSKFCLSNKMYITFSNLPLVH